MTKFVYPVPGTRWKLNCYTTPSWGKLLGKLLAQTRTMLPFLPLHGQRTVVTRSQEQAGALLERLVELGATVIPFPTLQFVPLGGEELAAAFHHLSTYDWLLFTSRNAVLFFFAETELPHILPRIAAIGSATAEALAEQGVAVQLMPDSFTGEELVANLGDLTGQKVLLPRSRLGRPEIVAQLQAQGAEVTEIALYDTIPAQPAPEAMLELAYGVDAITFTSPSTVQNFCQMVPHWPSLLNDAVVACIGPVTAAAAAQLGFSSIITAPEHTAEGVVKALVNRLNG